MDTILYLQHGKAPGPYRTERVEHKSVPLWWQLANISYTATGYGSRIPTTYMVKYNGRWRRVYCCVFSNSGVLFIGKNRETGIRVTEYGGL